MSKRKMGVKKPSKRSKKAPKTALGSVLQAAGRLLESNPDREDCQCDDLASGVLVEAPEVGGWCPFCAIERARIDQGEPLGLKAEALRNLAFTLDGEVYEDGEEVDRDALIFGKWEDEPVEDMISAFEDSVTRIERENRG